MNIDLARKLRKNSTTQEIKLWQHLRKRRFMGLKFRRQFPVGSYIVDFACLSHKLIIELDGGQHLEQQDYDNKRTLYLEGLGFKVLRFWNNEVSSQFDDVLEQIGRFTNKYSLPHPPYPGTFSQHWEKES